ncbi:MAG: hypothetical protein ABI325_11690 [Ginsengibacter sp.]
MNNEELADQKLELIANTTELSVAIKRLERKCQVLEEELKEDFFKIIEGLKPTNILKNTLHEIQESTPLKHNLLKVALGLGAGYFSRKMVIGKSAGLVKKALGAALQYGVTNFIAKKNITEIDEYQPKKKNLLQRILSV